MSGENKWKRTENISKKREKNGHKKGRENLSPEKPATTGLSARIAAEAWQQPRRDIAVKPQGLLVSIKTSPSELSSRLATEAWQPPRRRLNGGEIYRLLISWISWKKGERRDRVRRNEQSSPCGYDSPRKIPPTELSAQLVADTKYFTADGWMGQKPKDVWFLNLPSAFTERPWTFGYDLAGTRRLDGV